MNTRKRYCSSEVYRLNTTLLLDAGYRLHKEIIVNENTLNFAASAVGESVSTTSAVASGKKPLATLFEKDAQYVAVLYPVKDSSEKKTFSDVLPLKTSLQAFQGQISQDNTLPKDIKLLIPVAETRWWRQHWTLLEVNSKDGQKTADFYDSRSWWSIWFYPLIYVRDSLKAVFGKMSVETHSMGQQGILNSVDCGRYVSLYIAKIASYIGKTVEHVKGIFQSHITEEKLAECDETLKLSERDLYVMSTLPDGSDLISSYKNSCIFIQNKQFYPHLYYINNDGQAGLKKFPNDMELEPRVSELLKRLAASAPFPLHKTVTIEELKFFQDLASKALDQAQTSGRLTDEDFEAFTNSQVMVLEQLTATNVNPNITNNTNSTQPIPNTTLAEKEKPTVPTTAPTIKEKVEALEEKIEEELKKKYPEPHHIKTMWSNARLRFETSPSFRNQNGFFTHSGNQQALQSEELKGLVAEYQKLVKSEDYQGYCRQHQANQDQWNEVVRESDESHEARLQAMTGRSSFLNSRL